MLEEGNIIYFDPFYFPEGKSAPKSKYLIVLKKTDSDGVLASLPTTKDSIPAADVIAHGCIELPRINFNCFVISKDMVVTQCGKQLPRTSHIYGPQIDTYEIQMLESVYPNEGSDYYIFGKMRDDVFEDLRQCLITSRVVKRKFKRMLSE